MFSLMDDVLFHCFLDFQAISFVCVMKYFVTLSLHFQTIFEFFVGEDSIAIKQDLVDACEEFEVDMLVLGAKGPSSSMKEKLERTVVDILGSVPDYCVNHAQCSVSVIKPPNNYLQSK